MVSHLPRQHLTAEVAWIKGHARTLGNERMDTLAGKAAEIIAWPPTTFLAYPKFRVSEKFRRDKEKWHEKPQHYGSEEIPLPPPKSRAWIKLEIL
jgi:hypothetical protein